jgi:hypothetical protein
MSVRGFLLLAALSARAADPAAVSGIWTGQIPARNGELQDIAFQLVQQGSRVSGKLYGDYGSDPIVGGIVSASGTGLLITFVVEASEQAGNQINASRIRFSGSIRGGEMELIRERESSADAVNGAIVQPRANTPKPSFRLKRLL